MANFGDFLKPEVCGKTVLPDKNWWKMPKLKIENETFLGDFQTLW